MKHVALPGVGSCPVWCSTGPFFPSSSGSNNGCCCEGLILENGFGRQIFRENPHGNHRELMAKLFFGAGMGPPWSSTTFPQSLVPFGAHMVVVALRSPSGSGWFRRCRCTQVGRRGSTWVDFGCDLVTWCQDDPGCIDNSQVLYLAPYDDHMAPLHLSLVARSFWAWCWLFAYQSSTCWSLISFTVNRTGMTFGRHTLWYSRRFATATARTAS